MRQSIAALFSFALVAQSGCFFDQPAKPGEGVPGGPGSGQTCIPVGTELVMMVEASSRMLDPAYAGAAGVQEVQNYTSKWDLTVDAGKLAAMFLKPAQRAILSFPAAQDQECVAEECGWEWRAWYDDQSEFGARDWYWKADDWSVTKACDVADPQVAFGEVPGQYISGLELVRPGGSAPLADALLAAFNAIRERPAEGKKRHLFVVADGGDLCGGDAKRMVKKLRALGLDVWFVGFETSDAAALNELAILGGRPLPGARKFLLLDDKNDLQGYIRDAIGNEDGETCDAADNDCDGAVDEDLNRYCPLPCGGGVQTCHAGKWGACEQDPEVGWRSESCNGADDDCDGDTDEGFSLGAGCMLSVGQCSSFGATVCAVDGLSAVCNAPAPVTVEETCNGIDDDCDGSVDEGINAPCDTGCGSGWRVCLDGVLTECAVQVANLELCNGQDDDCDGIVDEGFEVGGPCHRGGGLCASDGVWQCSAEGLEVVCSADLIPWGVELCNGFDDDCDGEVDDNPTDCKPGEICYKGQCIYD